MSNELFNIYVADGNRDDLDFEQLAEWGGNEINNLRAALTKAEAEVARLRGILQETIDHVGRNVVCAYPHCGCDGARNCDAINGASLRAMGQNIEGKVNPSAAL